LELVRLALVVELGLMVVLLLSILFNLLVAVAVVF
jgi:hypothetical protein